MSRRNTDENRERPLDVSLLITTLLNSHAVMSSVGCVEVEETLPHLGVAVSLPSPNHGVRGHVGHARATVGPTRHHTALQRVVAGTLVTLGRLSVPHVTALRRRRMAKAGSDCSLLS